jgi:hypothetical protein
LPPEPSIAGEPRAPETKHPNHFATGRAQSVASQQTQEDPVELESKKNMETEKHDISEVAETSKLIVGNLDFKETDLTQLVEAFAKFGQIKEAFLSKPKAAGNKNAGWAIIVADEEVVRLILAATIVINNRVVRVTRAKPKGE